MYRLQHFIFYTFIAFLSFSLAAKDNPVKLKLSLLYNNNKSSSSLIAPSGWMVLNYVASEKNQYIILLKSTQKNKRQLYNELLMLSGKAPLLVLHDITWLQPLCGNKKVTIKQKHLTINSEIVTKRVFPNKCVALVNSKSGKAWVDVKEGR